MSHLLIAWNEIGTKEDPGRRNRGPRVDDYIRAGGLEPDDGPPEGYPWCMCFVVWCFREAGILIPRTASVARFWMLAAGHRVKGDAKEGDIAIHIDPKGNHTGIVEALDPLDNRPSTVEGNTNEEGSREGNAVATHTRDPGYWTGFVRYGA